MSRLENSARDLGPAGPDTLYGFGKLDAAGRRRELLTRRTSPPRNAEAAGSLAPAWNVSGSSASPTAASRACSTRSPARRPSSRRTRSPPPRPRSALAHVPDERVDLLGKMSNSKKLVYTGFEIVDIAALVKGASTGEGLGNRFLGSLRDCDAILYVLRAFEDPSVHGRRRPARPTSTRSSSSWCSPTWRRSRAACTDSSARPRATSRSRPRSPRSSGRPRCSATARRSTAPTSPTTSGSCSRRRSSSPTSRCSSSSTSARTSSTTVDELVAAGGRRRRRAGRVPAARGRGRRSSTPKARAELLEGLGLGEGVVPRVARAAYHLLGRRTFLTTGDTESRAWTFRAGAKAPECAGVIHSDLQRGLHPRRGDRLARSSSTSARGRRRRSRASCASRARTTRSSTATCSRSASTCDGAPGCPGSCATVTCWRQPRSPTTARARRRGLLGRDAFEGALVLRPCRHVHTVRHALPDRRRVLRRRRRRAAHGDAARRGGCRRSCAAPRS